MTLTRTLQAFVVAVVLAFSLSATAGTAWADTTGSTPTVTINPIGPLGLTWE